MTAPGTRKVKLTLEYSVSAATVFAAVVDLAGYDAWLPQSGVYKGTTSVSDAPLKTGSTYVEQSPSGTRHGEVRELDFGERHVLFHQPMRLRPYALGIEIDVLVDMRVVEVGGEGCRLEREVTLGFPLPLRLAAGMVERQFRDESWRTMERLKDYLEAKAG